MLSGKPIVYTRHAENALRERGLDSSWVAAAVRTPDWVLQDRTTEGAVRHFKSIVECDGRVLRVACLESASEIRILTAFFDRKARRPQ